MIGRKNFEAIDLFCGIGGLSYGLKETGIQVKAGLDFDGSCKETYENNIGATFIQADIANYNLEQLADFYSEDCIKVLVGCAPCQPFSSHSHKLQNIENDKRWNLIHYFTKAVEVLKPEIISIENVRGLVKTNVFSTFINDLEKLGYSINYDVIFCPDYGIPQNRYRLVLIGSNNKNIPLPKNTHSKETYKTVREAIGNLNALSAGEVDSTDIIHKSKNLAPINIKRIKQSQQGGTWKDWNENLLPDCYKKESGQTYTSVYGRMTWDSPSPTITTQFFNYGSGRFGHPEQDRALSVREGALLQTFPRSYKFDDTLGLQALGRHIGNAVPPQLGKVIGNAILNTKNGVTHG